MMSYIPACAALLCDQDLGFAGKLEVSREPSLLGVPPTQKSQGPRKRRPFPHLSSKQKNSAAHHRGTQATLPKVPGEVTFLEAQSPPELWTGRATLLTILRHSPFSPFGCSLPFCCEHHAVQPVCLCEVHSGLLKSRR